MFFPFKMMFFKAQSGITVWKVFLVHVLKGLSEKCFFLLQVFIVVFHVHGQTGGSGSPVRLHIPAAVYGG